MPLSLEHYLVTPCIWLDIRHPWNSPHYGPWVNCYFFTIYMYKHFLLPLLLVFVMKCYVSNWIALCLATLVVVVVRFLHLCVCFNCPSVHASTFHSLLAHHHLCYLDIYYVCTITQLFFILFYVYYSPSFMYYFCKYFLLPCFSWILCFCVNFAPDSFPLFGSMAFCIWVFYYRVCLKLKHYICIMGWAFAKPSIVRLRFLLWHA